MQIDWTGRARRNSKSYYLECSCQCSNTCYNTPKLEIAKTHFSQLVLNLFESVCWINLCRPLFLAYCGVGQMLITFFLCKTDFVVFASANILGLLRSCTVFLLVPLCAQLWYPILKQRFLCFYQIYSQQPDFWSWRRRLVGFKCSETAVSAVIWIHVLMYGIDMRLNQSHLMYICKVVVDYQFQFSVSFILIIAV